MIDSSYIQKLIDDSVRQLINETIVFITPYMPYLIGIIAAAFAWRLFKSIGEYLISFFGELTGRTKREIKNTKKWFRNIVDLFSAFKDILGVKK